MNKTHTTATNRREKMNWVMTKNAQLFTWELQWNTYNSLSKKTQSTIRELNLVIALETVAKLRVNLKRIILFFCALGLDALLPRNVHYRSLPRILSHFNLCSGEFIHFLLPPPRSWRCQLLLLRHFRSTQNSGDSSEKQRTCTRYDKRPRLDKCIARPLSG